MGDHLLVHRTGEHLPIDGQRGASGDARSIGAGEQNAPQGAQLGLEQPVGVGELHRFEGVAADELGEPIGLVSGSLRLRAHLAERDPDPALGQRPRCLRAGETSADDRGVHARATSPGSATTMRWPHLRQVRLSPSALLIFFSIPSQPQLGQVSGTGRFQVEKSHAG